MLRKAGVEAPVNQRVVEMALQIENGGLEASPNNAAALIECLNQTRSAKGGSQRKL